MACRPFTATSTCAPPAAEQFAGNLLIDVVVLDQQDRHPLQDSPLRQLRLGVALRRLVAGTVGVAELSQHVGGQGFLHDIGHAGWNIVLA